MKGGNKIDKIYRAQRSNYKTVKKGNVFMIMSIKTNLHTAME